MSAMMTLLTSMCAIMAFVTMPVAAVQCRAEGGAYGPDCRSPTQCCGAGTMDPQCFDPAKGLQCCTHYMSAATCNSSDVCCGGGGPGASSWTSCCPPRSTCCNPVGDGEGRCCAEGTICCGGENPTCCDAATQICGGTYVGCIARPTPIPHPSPGPAGSLRWERDMKSKVRDTPSATVFSEPAGVAVWATDGNATAVDAATGKTKWVRRSSDLNLCHDQSLLGLDGSVVDPSTGSTVATFTTGILFRSCGRSVYVGMVGSTAAWVAVPLLKNSPSSSRVVPLQFQSEYLWTAASPVGAVVIFAVPAGKKMRLQAFDGTTGLPTFTTKELPFSTQLTGQFTPDGAFYYIMADDRSGQMAVTATATGDVWVPDLTAYGHPYVSASAPTTLLVPVLGKNSTVALLAVDLRSHQVLWQTQGASTIGGEYTVFVSGSIAAVSYTMGYSVFVVTFSLKPPYAVLAMASLNCARKMPAVIQAGPGRLAAASELTDGISVYDMATLKKLYTTTAFPMITLLGSSGGVVVATNKESYIGGVTVN